MEFITSINLDAVVADPILMMGIFFVVVGPIFFVVSLWKFIRTKDGAHFVVPEESSQKEESEPVETSSTIETTVSMPAAVERSVEDIKPVVNSVSIPSAEVPPSVSISKPGSLAHVAQDQTIVMPAGMADVQAQIDILVAQIKQLNKKSIDLEESIESISRQLVSKMEVNELKETPANAQDFAQKLLKLAEHVIALEKEMAKLKAQSTKAQIMPL